MIAFDCPSCGKSLKVKDELAGKKVKCPGCQKPVAVPQPVASVSPPPSAPAEERTLPPKCREPQKPADPGVTNLGAGLHEATQGFPRPDGSRTIVLDEDSRRQFEAAWQAGRPVPIETFLAGKQVSHYLATLEELVHIDVEFRWKAWSEQVGGGTLPPLIETYLTRFPKLNHPEIVPRLVEQEFRARQRHGHEPALAEYEARFPGIKLQHLASGSDVTSFLAPAQQPDEIGRLGPYRVLKVLGSGGMGVVFKAEDPGLRRLVALKAMLPSLASTPYAKERFFREARSAAALKHAHIVGIYYVGEDRGAPFLAMEFLEGEPLDERLKRDKRLPIADVLHIGRQVAEGLAAAHDKGLIHRDIKPANIWLESVVRRPSSVVKDKKSTATDHGQQTIDCIAKILDFGLARALSDRTQLTQTGAIIGTPAYMAPEQAGGKPVDHRCDLFSLGCVLYRMCTGQMAFKGNDTISILSAIALHTPATPTDLNAEVPQELSDLVMSLLAKEAEHRPFSAHEVAKALAELETDDSEKTLQKPAKATTGIRKIVAAKTTVALSPLEERARGEKASRKKWLLLAGAFGALAALALALFFLTNRGREQPTESANAAPKEVLDKPVPAVPADKEKPFLVQRKDGTHRDFGTLENAFENLDSDSVVEIHGTGPFDGTSALVVKDKTLVIRAGNGYRPQIHVRLQQLFRLDGVTFSVEGCDFRMTGEGTFLCAGTGPAWEFNNCRFLASPGSGSPFLTYLGPRLKFTNCLISFPSDWNHGMWMRIGPGKMELGISNCILVAGGRSILPAGEDCDWKVNLQNNTVIHSGAILPSLDRIKAKLDVRAVGNIFQLNSSNGNTYAIPLVSTWKDKVRWEGSYNLYVGTKEGLALAHDSEGKKLTYGLAGWEEFWGKKEQGSADALRFFPTWRELFHAESPEALVAAARSLVGDSKLRTQNSRLANVGPNWDIVGPGEGYVRALTAAGKPVAKVRPEPPIEGLTFLVIRNGKIFRAFEHLREALGLSQNGDVVELRTDGPLAGEDLLQIESPRAITIRAAPGYTPVIRGYWRYKNLTLSVEGLHFENGGLHGLWDGGARLARVANCSFSADHGWPIAPGPENLRTSPDGSLDIVNSIVPGRIAPYVEPASRIIIRNSLVGWFQVEGEAGKSLFDIERSVLWQPLNFAVPNAGFVLGNRAGGGAPKLAIRDSLVENGTHLIWNNAKNAFAWTGRGNVYRLGEQSWCSQTPDGSPPPTSLLRWQALWNSDADSIRLDTHAYDPLQWKLLPGTPGFQKGPAGTDLGVDVSRIGTVTSSKNR